MKWMKRDELRIPEQGINRVESMMIGGIRQSILIQAGRQGAPVLLFVHGGPSMPVPGVCCRGADYVLVMTMKELVKQFTVVFWDQRGTGRSYAKDIPSHTMHLQQFVQDAAEVADFLRTRFDQDKIHVAAHSWGTVIGLPLVAAYPDKFHTYTAFSQITNWVENDRLSYKWLMEQAEARNDRKALQELLAVGEPPYLDSFKQWAVIRKWQFKYHSMFYDAGDNRSPTFFSGLSVMLRSPDFSLPDVYNSLVRGFKLSYSEEMLRDINTFDFFAEVPSLAVPVLFIHGRQEKHVMPELIERYYAQLDAPQGKQLLWSEKSSHAFHIDDARENEQRLIRHLLAERKPTDTLAAAQ